jgi:Ca2+-binding EF-hand superfamily protein
MKRIFTILSALIVSATFAIAEDKPAEAKPAAPAGEKPKHNPEEMFKKKDTNNDGAVSKEEFLAGAKDAAKGEEAFKRKDKDNDGKLTKEEFAAHGPKK